LKSANEKVDAIVEQIREEIANGEFNFERARHYAEQLKAIANETHAELEQVFADIGNVFEQVKAKIEATKKQVKQHLRNIIELLRPKPLAANKPNADWEAIKAEIDAIHAVAKQTGEEVVAIIRETHEEAAGLVADILKSANEKVDAIVEQIREEIANGEFNFERARHYAEQLQIIANETHAELAQVLADIKDGMEEVNAKVEAAKKQIKQHVQNIIEHLKP